MNTWLTKDLLQELKKVFQLRYERKISDIEAREIAYTLTDFMETYIKFKTQGKV